MSSRSGRGKRKVRGADAGSGWEEWGGYMQAKVQKLQNQFQSGQPREANAKGNKTNIFNGVAIHVNGYTKPTSDVLKNLMKEHGGVYHHYYSRSYVTHIIASNLPTSKIKQLTDKKVVKPEWITESIKVGKLLPYQDYLLIKKQIGIQRSLSRTSSTVSSNTIQDLSVITEAQEERERMGIRTDAEALLEGNNHRDQVTIIMLNDNPTELDDAKEQTKCCNKAINGTVLGKSANIEKSAVEIQNGKSEIKNSSPSKSTKSPGKAIKAGDPNFVSEYYEHSRLHHISAWGAEFKAYVKELQAKNCTSFPGRDRLREYHETNLTSMAGVCTVMKGKPQRVIMHVDMDCFFVSVGLRKRPDLIGKPVAVTHSKGKGAPMDRAGTNRAYEEAHWRRLTKSPSKNKGQDQKQLDLDRLFDDEADILAEEIQMDEPSEEASDLFYSMAEIASCSYEARAAGVKNGALMGPAKKLCPDLITIPYDFEAYKEVSQILYDTVASYTHDIEAVSCDEMLVDCTDLLADTGATPDEFASLLRQEISDKTGCNASAGIGPNILLAKLSTRKAKPNGQFYLDHNNTQTFILDKPVRNLPGVGWTIRNKLKTLNVETCGELQGVPLSTLQKEFGPKNGQSLYNYCRGKDNRSIKMEKERKSVSAEINYGIRFSVDQEAERFLYELSEEVHNRLVKINMKGKTITLKLKVRKEGAPKETLKYLGHGACDSVTKSTTLPVATDDPKVIGKESICTLKPLGIPVDDIRGIGISVTRLEAPIGTGRNSGLQTILNFATPFNKKDDGPATETKIDDKPATMTTSTENRPATSPEPVYEQISTTDAEVAGDDSPERAISPEFQLAGPTYVNDSLPPLPMLPDFSSPESSQGSQPDCQLDTIPLHSTPHNNTRRRNHSTPHTTTRRHLDITPVSHQKPITDDQFLISPSQVDLEVLKELPDDIRHQIETAMNRKKKKVPTATLR